MQGNRTNIYNNHLLSCQFSEKENINEKNDFLNKL